MPQQAILDTLLDELELYEELLETLHVQQEQLSGRESKGLEQSAEIIVSLVTETRDNRKVRSQLLADLELENTPEGMDIYLSELPASRQVEATETWEELVELVAECKAVNQVNGQLLNIQQQMTENLLQRLDIQNTHPAYSSDGHQKKEHSALYQTST
ncbi:hypothetical protein EOPP23_13150 [Endozoicomonas sp. OPT23]|uniref:flagellar export chaperone FlgN n=1 Tax=Endozoicomonas sp. OPT23 TaxID=2072845 RepID=UPI00129A7FA7|nr:flagellar export chaperone FlgN [Endozoicomonas sp. OPT23]MRI33936.1 hypothetical protein [Endozoicomonas sp. OPT23]